MPPAIPENDELQANLREMLGMSLLLPEPEVLKAELSAIGCKTLAGIIAKLVAENEPLLTAEHDGATVTVRERGGDGVFKVTVEAL